MIRGHYQMPHGIDMIYTKMMERIAQIAKSDRPDKLQLYEELVDACFTSVKDLRDHVVENPFSSPVDEIGFFKFIKPRFISELRYWQRVYFIELKRPVANKKTILKYFAQEYWQLEYFFERNKSFHEYLRTGGAQLDNEYFLRSNKSSVVPILYFDADPEFSTSHDLIVAEIMASERVKDFLENEVAQLKNKLPAVIQSAVKINTSLSVAHLACLLRLLHEEKIFSHSNQTELLEFFASHFSTARQEQISSTSLRSKYYNIERSTSEAVKDVLFQLLNRIKKI